MFENVCALLLRLYPAEFRRAYGREAVQLIRDPARHERGVLRRIRLLMDLAIDLCATSLHGWQPAKPLLARVYGAPRFDIIDVHGPRPEALAAGLLTSIFIFATFTLSFQPNVLPSAPAHLGKASRSARPGANSNNSAQHPDHRLVADELERRWNTALQRVREIEARIDQHVHGGRQPVVPTRDEFENLAADLEAVWRNPHADVRLKKRLVRTLIHEVVVDIDAEAGEVILVIHWKGAVHTELRLPRRRRGQSATHTSKDVVDAVRVLARICPDDLLANVLNRNGLLTGRGNRWTRERVVSLRTHHAIACYDRDRRASEGWMNLNEAARVLGISPRTLRLAVERGEIDAAHPLPDGPWVFQRQALDAPAAAALVARVRDRTHGPAVPHSQQRALVFSGT